MDKASANGAGDCRFESCRGHSWQKRIRSMKRYDLTKKGNLLLASIEIRWYSDIDMVIVAETDCSFQK